jgi:MFS family permease
MSDPANKTEFPPRPILPEPHLHNITGDESGVIQQQRSWKYREYRMSFIRIPSYASPPIQLVIIAFVCFLCPGMLNALTGIGGSGQINHRVADDANTALYSTFAIFGFFAGTFINVLGIKIAVVIGAFGYSVYMAAFLCYSSTGNSGFTIFAGALLGFCAALLWTAEGTILMSYPPEQSKGKYISGLWMIFNFGAVIGSLVRASPFDTGINF